LYELGLQPDAVNHYFEGLSPPRRWSFSSQALVDASLAGLVFYIVWFHVLRAYQPPLATLPLGIGVALWISKPWKIFRLTRAEQNKIAAEETGGKILKGVDAISLRALIDACAR
jgi:hypothetical protein